MNAKTVYNIFLPFIFLLDVEIETGVSKQVIPISNEQTTSKQHHPQYEIRPKKKEYQEGPTDVQNSRNEISEPFWLLLVHCLIFEVEARERLIELLSSNNV